MNRNSRLAALTVLSSLVLAGCGGGGGDDVAAPVPPPPPAAPTPPAQPTDAVRSAAAQTTATTNTMCSATTIGSFYWEIGDSTGVKASGSVGTGAPVGTSVMSIASSSKWLYASSVLQRRGVLDADVPYLNFTSGYTNFGNIPACIGSTVSSCLPGKDTQDAATIGKYFYDSGHMQRHAAAVMGLGAADDAALATDLRAGIGDFGFTYTLPQLAAGVSGTPANYGAFLRKILRGELTMGSALGTHKVCANPATCPTQAVSAPELGANESWNYSLGHWVEDDPTVGDHSFSSAGGAGFYPWIDSTKTYYGIVARFRTTESDAGYHSAQCGRLIRQAFKTGIAVTASLPTPS